MPASEEMVERGARAIATFLSDGDGGPGYDDLPKHHKEQALDTARACLTAALSDQVVVPKEPTREMLDAGTKASVALYEKLVKAAHPYQPVFLHADIARMLVEYRAMIAVCTPPQPSEDNGPDTNGGQR